MFTFVIRRFAEFKSAAQVADLFMEERADALQSDVSRHGRQGVKDWLLRKIRSLDPTVALNIERGTVSGELLELFEDEQKIYGRAYMNNPLAHRRTRLDQLEYLLHETIARLQGADDSDAPKYLQAATRILAESRAEMSDKKVDLEASVDQDGKATFAVRGSLENMSTDELKDMLRHNENGKPIQLPPESGNGSGEATSLSPDPTGAKG